MKKNKRSAQVAKALDGYLKTGGASLIEGIPWGEIEEALLQYHQKRGHPVFDTIEKRAAELKEAERSTRERIARREKRIIGFIAGSLSQNSVYDREESIARGREQ